MNVRMKWWATAFAAVVWLGSTNAYAQDEQDTDVEEEEAAAVDDEAEPRDEAEPAAPPPAEPQPAEPAPVPAPAPAPAPAAPPPAEAAEAAESADEETSDHEQVVGHVGVGLLGSLSVPTGVGSSVTLQTLGIRYWMAPSIGLDVGVGLGFSKSKQTEEAGGMDMTLEDTTQVGFSLHGGVPIAPVWSDHFTFLLVPEVDIGFGTMSEDTDPDDLSRFGLMVRAGARVGAEIQFGFIGIPQLSLQASVGAYLAYDVGKVKADGGESTRTTVRFDTTTQGDPWDIFTGSLAAIYYF